MPNESDRCIIGILARTSKGIDKALPPRIDRPRHPIECSSNVDYYHKDEKGKESV